MLPLRRVRGTTSEVAHVCAVQMYSISRYFARTPSERKEPDGEVALGILNWLVSKRMRWSLSKTEEAPPIEPERTALHNEAAFAVEYRLQLFILEASESGRQSSGLRYSLANIYDRCYNYPGQHGHAPGKTRS